MMSMRIGEKAELVIKPEYGYGEQGAGADIPPNATLIFKVEILQIDEAKAKKFKVSDEELLQKAKDLKEQGNAKFKGKEFAEAAKFYREAVQIIKKMKELTKDAFDLLKSCHLNMAVVSNNFGKYQDAIDNCN